MTKGVNTPDAGNRRLFHWTGLYNFENSVQGQLRFDAGYFNESVHSSYADADLSMRGKKVPVYRGRRKISTGMVDFSAEYTGRTGRNDYMVRAGMSRMKKDSYSYNGRHLQGLPLFLAGHLNRYFPKENSDNARYSTYFLEAKDTVKSERHTFTFGGDYRNIAYEGTRLADNAAGLPKRGNPTPQIMWRCMFPICGRQMTGFSLRRLCVLSIITVSVRLCRPVLG